MARRVTKKKTSAGKKSGSSAARRVIAHKSAKTPKKVVRAARRPAADKSSSKPDAARELAILAARTAHDNKAEEIVVLDLRGVSPMADYFVICTGTSDRQMRTVAEEASKAGAGIGQKVWKVAGMESGEWILLDFVDVVVHVLDSFHRRYYDLEMIWGGSPRVTWRRKASAAKKAAKATKD